MSNEYMSEAIFQDTVDMQSWTQERTGRELGSFVARRFAALGDDDQDITDLLAA